MASFNARIGWKIPRKRDNKSCCSVSFSTRSGIENAEKKEKKLKKLKNTIMASFQTKIVWKRPRKRENKNYRFVPFLPVTL